MKRWIKIIVTLSLLAGVAILCVTRWQAWFGMPAEPQWNDETYDYVFPSAEDTTVFQPFANDSLFTILVMGDIHNRLKREDYDSLAARVPNADLVIQIGDWMDRGQNYYYQLLVREWSHSALFGLPVIATPGNHEYSKGLQKSLSPVWKKAFQHPHNGPVGVPGASYYIDLPSIRLISIDTNPLDRIVYLTRTHTWLTDLMKTAGDRYTVIIMHHPVLSVGKGRANVAIYSAFRHALGKADLVIAGHDHSYMRRQPFVVLNTAGKTKAQHTRYIPEKTDTVPAYGVIQPQASQLKFHVYRLSDNALIDSLHVTHD